MKDSRLNNLIKVNYQEIPSLQSSSEELWLTHGLHVILTYKQNKELIYHKIFISSSFKTIYTAQIVKLSRYDLVAYHVYNYIKCRCTFTSQAWKVLWLLLRQSNSFYLSIRKLFLFIK